MTSETGATGGAGHVPLTAVMLRRNLSSVGVSYAVGAVAGFATQSVLGHHLGSRTYGVYATALALATTVSAIQEVAGPAWLVRSAAADPAAFPELSGSVLTFRLGAGVLVVAVTAIVAAALGLGVEGVEVACVVAVVAGLNAVLRALRTGFQVAERMPVSAAVTTANAVATALVMIGLVVAGAGLIPAVVGSAVVSLVLVPVAWRLLAADHRPRLTRHWAPLWGAARSSLPFTVVAVLETVLSYADMLVIRVALGPTQAGLYGGAYRLVTVLQWLPSIVLDSVMRGLSSAAAHDRAAFRDLVDRAAAGLLLVAVPLAAAGGLIAHPVITVVFGDSFAGGADAFRVLLWSLPLSYPAWIASEAALVGARPGAFARLVAVVVVGNVVVNALVVPRVGIVGAAWTTLGSEACVLAIATVMLQRRGLTPRWLQAVLPAAVLGAVTAAAVAPVRDESLWVPVVSGCAAYAAAAVLAWRVLRRTRWGDWLLGSSAVGAS